MVSLIDKYLDQIKKNLRNNSIDKAYIDEFIENLGNQLYTQLEELQAQNLDLSLEDAEIQVLTSCEPVKIVVQRVVTELRADEPRVIIDHFTTYSVLQPIELVILTVLKQLDKGLLFIGKKIRFLKEWYLKNENPLLTSVYYLLAISCSIIGVAIFSFFLPPVIFATTFPDNKSYLFLYDVPNHIWSNPEITSISTTSFSLILSTLIISLIVFVLMAHLGWKYSTAYVIKVGGFLSLCIVLLWSLSLTNYRFLIKNRTFDMTWGFTTTSDWIRTQKPSVQQYLNFLLQEMAGTFVLGISMILIFIILGSLLRTFVKERPSLNNRQTLMNLVIKIGLILICMSSFSFARQFDSQFPGLSNAPLPSYSEQPMLYHFGIDWTLKYPSRNFSDSYLTILPQFGGISFYFDEVFNISLPNEYNPENFDLSARGNLSPVLNESDEPSSSSQAPFLLVGLLYLPSRFQNQDWQDLLASHVNSSYPFLGYEPNPSSELTTIDWKVNYSDLALKVNTLVYSSLSNSSTFTFSFDAKTGWLMYATLTLNNQSWVSGMDLETLTITRVFTYNQIQSPNDYYLVDTLLSNFILIGTVFLFGLVGIYYYKRPGKNH